MCQRRIVETHPYLQGSLKTPDTEDGPWRLAPLRKKRYVSGDVRADEIPGLLGMHTVFIREHNRIAKFLRRRRPQWTGEEVFQHARWIRIAQLRSEEGRGGKEGCGRW